MNDDKVKSNEYVLNDQQLTKVIKQALQEFVMQLNLANGLKRKLYTIEEMAEYMRYNKNTLYNYVQQKRIPFHKNKGRVYFDKDEIDVWMGIKQKNKDKEIDLFLDEN